MSFKIAMIGCGWVSNECHGPAAVEYASAHPGIELSACCDVDGERAERFRSRFGFQLAYTNFSAMLDAGRPHAVCLNVPPHLITGIGCAVLERGVPLLVEKPPGLSVDEVDLLIGAARSSGAIHQVAFNRRFMPLVVEMKKRLAGRPIHHLDVQLARVHRTDPVFATTAIHAIDAARFITGSDYTRLDISYQELPEQGPGVANYTLDGTLASGATAHLSVFPVSGGNLERFVVYALDSLFILDAYNAPDAPGRLVHFENGQCIYEIDAELFTGRRESYFLNGFYQEDAAFYDAVQAGEQPVHNFASCRQPLAVMQALIERNRSYS